MTDVELEDARQKMIASRFGGVAPTHGKGASRRKKKVKSKNTAAAQSDAKLTTVVNKLGATHIPGIEEVNFFKEDGTVLQFKNPKVQASIAANTYVISGPNQQKALQEMLPGIVSQFGGMEDMQQAMMMQSQQQQMGMTAPKNMIPEEEDEDDDDDDVPDLVEGNFEDVSEK